jgi:hypothetical protein
MVGKCMPILSQPLRYPPAHVPISQLRILGDYTDILALYFHGRSPDIGPSFVNSLLHQRGLP